MGARNAEYERIRGDFDMIGQAIEAGDCWWLHQLAAAHRDGGGAPITGRSRAAERDLAEALQYHGCA